MSRAVPGQLSGNWGFGRVRIGSLGIISTAMGPSNGVEDVESLLVSPSTSFHYLTLLAIYLTHHCHSVQTSLGVIRHPAINCAPQILGLLEASFPSAMHNSMYQRRAPGRCRASPEP